MNKMVPSDRRRFEYSVEIKTARTNRAFNEMAAFNVSYSGQPDPAPVSYDATKQDPLL
jgi:hypothetical protein